MEEVSGILEKIWEEWVAGCMNLIANLKDYNQFGLAET